MKASWCSGVHSDFTCCLVSKVNGFAIFVKFFYELPVKAYKSQECTYLFRSCWWMHLLNCLCVWKVVDTYPWCLKCVPSTGFPWRRKLCLLNFIASFADLSFLKTFFMCNRCSSAVLLKWWCHLDKQLWSQILHNSGH